MVRQLILWSVANQYGYALLDIVGLRMYICGLPSSSSVLQSPTIFCQHKAIERRRPAECIRSRLCLKAVSEVHLDRTHVGRRPWVHTVGLQVAGLIKKHFDFSTGTRYMSCLSVVSYT